jgi:hypothetical protein
MSRGKRASLLGGLAAVCVVGVVFVLLIDGGSATTARDSAATNSYLAARRTLQANSERSRVERTSAVKAYVAGIVSTCAGTLRGAPPPITGKRRFTVRKGSTVEIAPRVILFLDAAEGVEQRMRLAETAAIREFTREVRGLRWTDSVLTKLVHALADVEDAQLEQEAPEQCRDARAWAASGYKILASHGTRTTERLGTAKEALEQALTDGGCSSPFPGRAVLHMLERTMSRGQRRTAEELSRLEARITAENATIVDTAVAQIERALGARLGVAPVERGKAIVADRVPACVAVPRITKRRR